MSSILFIGGCERSGTTMLASLLNASEKCVSAPEAQFKFWMLNERPFSEVDKDRLKNDFRFGLWNNEDFVDEICKDEKLSNKQVFTQLLKFRFKGEKHEYFIDHTPNNFEHYQSLRNYFPNAKFLHIIRDGRSVYNSLKSVTWGPKDPIAAARWWMKKVGWGLAPLTQRDAIYSVHYEDILERPKETISNICDWLKIEFNKNMLTGDGSFLPSYTSGQHQLVGKGLSKDRVDKWKRNLTNDEVFLFQREADVLLQNLGYKLLKTEFKMRFYTPLLYRIRGRFLTNKGNKEHKRKQEIELTK